MSLRAATILASHGDVKGAAMERLNTMAEELLAAAEHCGLVVTIHLESQKPLAMRNYRPVI